MIASRLPRRVRKGVVTAEVLTLLAALGVLTTTAFVITPRLLRAGDDEQGITAPRTEAHQASLTKLVEALQRCIGIVAVHDREHSPYLDLILWADDVSDPGHINENEVLVLSHSRLLQTLTMYTRAPGPGADRLFPQVDVMRQPEFAARWRARVDVEAMVIETGVPDMRFVDHAVRGDGASGLSGQSSESHVIELTWGGNRADESDVGQGIVRLPMIRAR